MKEFQIVYREQRSLTMGEAAAAGVSARNGDAVAPHGPVIIARVCAEKESEIRKVFAGYHVEKISTVRVLLEPDQNVFNLEEAAQYLRCSTDQVGRYMATGKLPKAREGYPKFLRRWLDKLIEEELMAVPEEKAA